MQGVWALTGGIASGKTTVASMLEARGAIVIDADQIARDVVAPGTPGLAQIVDAFGDSVLLADGTLNREALGAKVFADPALRSQLNQILHPLIFMASIERMQAALKGDRSPVFYDAALIVENGSWQMFDGLVVVAADAETQRLRLMERNQLSAVEAQQRIDAQFPLAKKIEVATFVIRNEGSLEALEEQVESVLAQVRERIAQTQESP